ncbi:MAG: GntR family transcriptional regulator [Chitinivibrionales bacterium]|nr:GntR family transcriptional regulator [Chitinivibrionales bacterium]MBD3358172.1 GntR family transcriptional regulator [Chitinivibrionales bacterium]
MDNGPTSLAAAHHETKNPAKAFTPLYRRVAQAYRDQIVSCILSPGMRIDSISRIQEHHGVSRETAKKVLKVLADEGLIVQKAGMGSFIADRKPIRRIWGVVVPFYSYHYEYLLEQLATRAWSHGRQFRHFLSYNSWEEEIRLVGRLVGEQYEAVIVAPTLDESRTADFYGRLCGRESFVMLIDHTVTGSFFPYVIQSYDLGVKRALRYLFERTPRRIAFVRNQVWLERNLVQEIMEETYREIMREERAGTAPLVIDRMSRIDKEFVKANDVGGFFCCDDGNAIRIVGRLRNEGISFPEECTLVSYGNTEPARYFTPAITSIDPHSEEMTGRVMDILERTIHGESTEYCQYVVQPEIVIRKT